MSIPQCVKDKYSCILGVIILLCNNPVTPLISEHQIRGGIEDNSRIIFNFLNENICCDETVLMIGHKICFCGKNLDNYPQIIPVIPSYLEH